MCCEKEGQGVLLFTAVCGGGGVGRKGVVGVFRSNKSVCTALCVCDCVSACVSECVCVWVRVRACVRACSRVL